MKEFLKQFVEWGTPGVFILSAVDSAGIPIPNGVDAMIAAVVVDDSDKALLTMLAAIVGSLIGNIILFFIARKGGQAYLDKVASKQRARKFRGWFEKYGLVTVFVPAISLFPMPLKFFVASAAIFDVPLVRFLSVMAVARIIRYGFIAWIASRFGKQLMVLVWAQWPWFLLGIAALGVAFFYISRLILKTSGEEAPAEPAEETGP